MKSRTKKVILWVGTILGALCLLLAWPLATWLWCKEKWAGEQDQFDSVYLVAGASQQESRIRALSRWVKECTNGKEPMLLVGNDAEKGKWSSEYDRNLSAGEWAIERLRDEYAERAVTIQSVAGDFSNTDSEMRVLAGYLKKNDDIASIALVTSAFHARRVMNRLSAHLERDVRVSVIVTRPSWHDRAPWLVALEMAKMARDRMGLSQAPVVSRR